MQGFYIKELRITGFELDDASIILEKGLNVINGPSNTGKSYIFSCIDYMFGADALKIIKESKGYEKIYMEIRDFATNSPITILRFIDNKTVYYSLTSINKFHSIKPIKLKADHNPNKEDNISKFLLKQIGITENKFLLSNQNGVKKTLGFRAIVNLSMISETKIISDRDTDSPIFNKGKMDETYCKSVFKFLLTMVDDINCEEVEKAEIRKAKIDSKIEYINNEILILVGNLKTIQNQLEETTFEDIISINEYTEEISRIENAIEDKRKIINDKKISQNKLNFQKNQYSLLIDKFEILHNQYESDLLRLAFLQDGEDCLNQIHFNHCPICNNEVDNATFNDEDSTGVLEASLQEEAKIKMHLLELDKTIASTKLDVENIDFINQEYLLEIEQYKDEINDLISNDLTPLKDVLMTSIEISNTKFKLKDIEDRISSKKGELIGFIETKKQKQPKLNYKYDIPEDIINEFTDEIKKTLKEWGYKDLISVVFDLIDQDIIINGQSRKSNGKGYRAFFYAAFSVSLMNYLFSKNYSFTRVLLLDSPVTTLKETELEKGIKQDGDIIDPTMQDSLFISLSKNSNNMQVIILENKELPDEVKLCNHIAFTKGLSEGRYGFFPLKDKTV